MLTQDHANLSNPVSVRKSARLQIAFVGGGPSCVAAYLEIADRLSYDVGEITIFDPQGLMGSNAFNTHSDALLTNTSVGVTSIKPNCDYDFLSWIRSNHREKAFTPESFVPRKMVGEYIRDRFEAAREHLSSLGCTTTIVKSAVTDILPSSFGKKDVYTSENDYHHFDYVIVCAGCAAKPLPSELSEHVDAISEPYPERQLVRKTSGAKNVLILGSKLSAIDAALVLLSLDVKPKLTMASRSGSFPSVRDALLVHSAGRFSAPELQSGAQGSIYQSALRAAISDLKDNKCQSGCRQNGPCLDPIQQLALDITDCEDGKNYWQSSMGSFIDEINNIWPMLSSQQQIKFQVKFRKFNSRLISAFPIENARILYAALSSEDLSIVSGEMNTIVEPARGGGFSGLGQLSGQHFDKIVNATGVDAGSFVDSSLGRRLQSTGWSLNFHGGLAVNPRTMEMQHKLGWHDGLYAIGAPITGSLLITNYLRSSVIQAQRAVKHIHQLVHLPQADHVHQ
jgi:uncharacterized NAD(P)/FAD-binding protein YdhS